MIPAVIPYPNLDPVIFRIGPVAVRWYGLAYVAGMALAYLWLRRMARRGTLRLNVDGLNALMGWIVVGVMLGGRLGWWFVYHPAPVEPEPWYEPFAIWHGGMSFHGGLLGVLTAVAVFSWVRKAPFWNLADCVGLTAPVGLFFGRLANFINAELVGRQSDVPWAMVFPGDTVARHPSQLYEALLEGLVLLAALWAVKLLARPPEGTITGLAFILYATFRFLVEFTREPDAALGFIAFGWLTMGQVLCAGMALLGVVLLAWSRCGGRKTPKAPTIPTSPGSASSPPRTPPR
jgi:phosphatidylglycerol---prolipoprotein diacylglyceryl transferase